MRARLTRGLAFAAALAAVGAGTAGCAYFNTFYSARRNFDDAERQMRLQPDPEARASAGAAALYDKAMQGSTKIIVEYPTSKWVDDAVLLIGRSMLAKGDYQAAQLKFAELGRNFPESDLSHEAVFWSGVAAERDRRRPEAIALFDSVLTHYPKSRRRDEALLRRSNLYLLEKRPDLAEPSLRELAQRKDRLGYDAGIKLADAMYAGKRWAEARVEYARVAERAPTEQLRQDARLRVGDCDEALGEYDAAVRTYAELLRDSRTEDGKARARLRYASALGLAGRPDQALSELANVIEDRPRTTWAAEAAFRAGYLHEVVRDDFASARASYDAVATQQPGSPFVGQAKTRRDNLEKLETFRAAQGDSAASDAAAQAIFESAELFLFQLGKPEKALAEYAKLENEFPNSAFAPRAAFAQGWVQARRMGDAAAAQAAFERVLARWPDDPVAEDARRMLANPTDSAFVHADLPATSVQYPLVPGNPIYVPPPPAPATRTTARPATGAPPASATAAADSAARALRSSPQNAVRDSLLRARADSVRAAQRQPAPPPPAPVPPDTSGGGEP